MVVTACAVLEVPVSSFLVSVVSRYMLVAVRSGSCNNPTLAC
jgi:hypothetical protein